MASSFCICRSVLRVLSFFFYALYYIRRILQSQPEYGRGSHIEARNEYTARMRWSRKTTVRTRFADTHMQKRGRARFGVATAGRASTKAGRASTHGTMATFQSEGEEERVQTITTERPPASSLPLFATAARESRVATAKTRH